MVQDKGDCVLHDCLLLQSQGCTRLHQGSERMPRFAKLDFFKMRDF